jgi:hypothetical protein
MTITTSLSVLIRIDWSPSLARRRAVDFGRSLVAAVSHEGLRPGITR